MEADINELYSNIKELVGDNYFSFDVKIDKEGKVTFCTYISIGITGENIYGETPDILLDNIKFYVRSRNRKEKDISKFKLKLTLEDE